MVVINVAERSPTLRITDDRTYQEITIYARDDEQMNELILKLTTELLKGE